MTSYQIGEAWKDAVRDSIAVNEFCMERFGKEPLLFMDMDPHDVPGQKHAPFVAFLPHGLTEGGCEQDENRFAVSVFVVMYDREIEQDGREFVFRGRRVIEKEFNPLVLTAIKESGEFVPGKQSWEVAQLGSGLFLLENILTVNLPNTLGL